MRASKHSCALSVFLCADGRRMGEGHRQGVLRQVSTV